MWEHTNKVLQEYAILVRNKYQDSLIKNDRIATGDLLNNVEYHIKIGEQYLEVSLNLQDYWRFVEWDTKPHFPPIDAILKYIEAKPINPREDDKGRLPTPRQLAYLIGRKISEEGTKGTHDLENTLKEVNALYMDKIEEAVLDDVMEDLNIIISQIIL